jgi:NADH-quinone oxidoreductase subunit F
MSNKNTRSLSARKEFEPNLFEEISHLAYQDKLVADYDKLAKDFLMNDSTLYGTASFYDFTKVENRGKKIHICNGSACLTSGTQKNVYQEVIKHFSDAEIGHAACLGHCHTNAALLYNDTSFSLTNELKIDTILEKKIDSNNSYFVGSDHHPILTQKIENLSDFYLLANLFKDNPPKVITELKNSNLRGRGGAGFPFWFKLDAVSKENSQQKYIVCNADEGDPGAYSDMYLLENQPHKVLFGMYVSGLTVGADTGILYIRAEYPNSIKTIEKSIEEIEKQNLTPHFKWKIIKGQGAYVCGEETALLNSIEGLRPEVRVRPPYPAQYGLFGKPTVLSNVETFANIHWILQNSGLSYANIGTNQSKGTKLVSLDSHFNRPGIYEITMGTSVNEVIEKYGLGFKHAVKGIQIGGPLGGIVPIHKLNDLTLDFESFSQQGFLLGHASFVCIPNDFPMIEYLKHLLKFASDESCGKCFPCRIGTFRGYELLQKAQNEDFKVDMNLMNDLLETLEKGSLCALGGGVPLPVRNALQYFEEELKEFFNPLY